MSADGGNFEEAAGWRTNVRPEPSFEEVFLCFLRLRQPKQ